MEPVKGSFVSRVFRANLTVKYTQVAVNKAVATRSFLCEFAKLKCVSRVNTAESPLKDLSGQTTGPKSVSNLIRDITHTRDMFASPGLLINPGYPIFLELKDTPPA